MPKSELFNTLTDPTLRCSCALVLCVDRFGAEMINWDPITVAMELRDLLGEEADEALLDKIQAASALLANDNYHRSLEVFLPLNAAFSLRRPSDSTLSYNSVEDIMWGLTEARLLEGGEDFEAAGFDDRIARVVGMQLSLEGSTKPPPIMKFAQFSEQELDNRDLGLSGDALMSEAYWTRQDKLIDELNQYASDRLRELFKQLASLPLMTKEAKTMAAKLAAVQP